MDPIYFPNAPISPATVTVVGGGLSTLAPPEPPNPPFELELLGYEPASRSLVLRDATVYLPGFKARAELALFVVGERREPTRRVALPVAGSFGATLAAEFRLVPGADGWVEAGLCALALADTALAPPSGDALPTPAPAKAGSTPALPRLGPPPAPEVFALVPTGLFVYDATAQAAFQRYAQLQLQPPPPPAPPAPPIEQDSPGTEAGPVLMPAPTAVPGPVYATVFSWQPATALELLGTPAVKVRVSALVTVASSLLRARLNEACLLLDYDEVADQFTEPRSEALRRAYRLVRNHLEAATYHWQAGVRYAAAQNLASIDGLRAEQLLA